VKVQIRERTLAKVKEEEEILRLEREWIKNMEKKDKVRGMMMMMMTLIVMMTTMMTTMIMK
jgi:hypothetical protein